MNVNELIEQGNQFRAERRPQQALDCYIQAIGLDRNNSAAWNNYGNVAREMGDPDTGIAFLKKAIKLNPTMETAQFNLAVAYLLAGDYENGWQQYEKRWDYEHLKGLLPKFPQPRWTGQDLKDKTIFVMCEQGHGDTIQFVRFCQDLKDRGAHVIFHSEEKIAAMLKNHPMIDELTGPTDQLPSFDYWTPVMSIPGVLGITLDQLKSQLKYITPPRDLVQKWQERLGAKRKMRVGLCWSGRRDTWIHQHKSVPFEVIREFVRNHPQYDWISFQLDATSEELSVLTELGVRIFNDEIATFADTAALMENMDVVVGVDTAATHLAGAIGRPAWLLLNQFGQDWRWLLERGDSPWYQSVRIFRQPQMDDWETPLRTVSKFLDMFRV